MSVASWKGASMTSTSTTTDQAPEERVLVGVLVRPHGVRGEAWIDPRTDRLDRFEAGNELWLVPRGGGPRRVRLASARPHRGGFLVTIDGIEAREELDELRGAALEVGRDEVAPPPAGRFWLFDLIGCRCRDRTAGDLGEIVEMVEDGGGWLAIVDRPGGRRLAIPFVGSFIVTVEVAARRVEWDLPKGLIESCESRS